jgi:hypothetical protein
MKISIKSITVTVLLLFVGLVGGTAVRAQAVDDAVATFKGKTYQNAVFTGRTKKTTLTAITPSATPSIDASLSDVYTLTPGEDETISITNGAAYQPITLIILTSGVTSRTLTFGTGFKSTGTLATGTSTGKYFVIEFICDGTNCYEKSRTTAM